MAAVSRVRVAVVGLGGISQSVHLPLLSRGWQIFEITAVVDLSSSRTDEIAGRYGVPAAGRFRSVSELLSAREAGAVAVDGVLLATTGSHAPEVAQLVAAGLPVLSEKPLALGLAEIDAIERAAPEGTDLGACLMVGYMKEYDPATTRARAELADVTLRAVTVEVLHPADAAQLHFARLMPAPADVDPATVAALGERTAGAVDDAIGPQTPAELRALYSNVVLGSVVHDIALLRYLVGGVETVDRAVHWGDGPPGSLEVTGTVAGGARLHVGWHFIPDYPDYRETVTFHHETGSVELVFSVPYLLNVPTELTVVSRASGRPGVGAGEVRSTYRWKQEEAFENELSAFHALVTQGTPGLSGLAEGRADVAVAQRIMAALATAKGVALGGEAAAVDVARC